MTFDEITKDFDAPKRTIQGLKAESGQIALGHFDQGLVDYESEYDKEYTELDYMLDNLDRIFYWIRTT